MANAYVTVDKYEDLLKRVKKVENQYSDLEKFKEKVLEVEFRNKEVKTDNKEIKTEFSVEFKIMRQRFDSVDQRFSSVEREIAQGFNSMGREIGAMWRILIPIFVAILIMMFRLFGVI